MLNRLRMSPGFLLFNQHLQKNTVGKEDNYVAPALEEEELYQQLENIMTQNLQRENIK